MTRKKVIQWSYESAAAFFANSDWLDRAVLRPISHVAGNWELTWNTHADRYEPESDSLADHLNVLIHDMAASKPPADYHHYENKLAISYDDVKSGRFKLNRSRKLWIDTATNLPVSKDMVGHMIEQATCGHYDVPDLVLSAAGRVATSLRFGVSHFDDLDDGHLEMLSVIMTDILFRRSDRPA